MLWSVTSWLCCWGDNTLPGTHRPWLVKKHLGLWGRCLVGNEGRGDLYPFFKLLPLGLGLLWWFGTASSGCGISRGFGQGVGASASLFVRLYWPWKQGVCGYLPQDLRCMHFPQRWCYGHRLWCRGAVQSCDSQCLGCGYFPQEMGWLFGHHLWRCLGGHHPF